MSYREASEDWRTKEACARYFRGDLSGAELLSELDKILLRTEKRLDDCMDYKAEIAREYRENQENRND